MPEQSVFSKHQAWGTAARRGRGRERAAGWSRTCVTNFFVTCHEFFRDMTPGIAILVFALCGGAAAVGLGDSWKRGTDNPHDLMCWRIRQGCARVASMLAAYRT